MLSKNDKNQKYSLILIIKKNLKQKKQKQKDSDD